MFNLIYQEYGHTEFRKHYFADWRTLDLPIRRIYDLRYSTISNYALQLIWIIYLAEYSTYVLNHT